MDLISASSSSPIAARSTEARDNVVPRPAAVRSAVTNDPLMLRGVDGRSMVARRYRDVAIALADDLGGQDRLSEPSKILVRQAAAMTVQVEGLQSKIVSGEDVDLEQLTRLSNVLGRTLQRLGLKKPRSKPSSPLAAHFSRPPKRLLPLLLVLLAVCCWQPRSAHAQGACTAGCVQWNYGSSSSGTTDSSVLTGVVAGHSIRVWVCSSGSGFTGFTATVGGNAATVGSTVVTGGCGMAGMAVYSNVAAGSITTVVTFTGSSPTCITCTIFVEEWAGDSTTGHDPLDGENAVYVSGSSVSVPCAMTQGTSGDTLEVFYQDSNGTTPAVTPSGYTQAYNFATRFFYYKTGGASGTNTPTFTSGSGSVDNNAVCAGFVQAGSGGGAPPLRSLMGVGK